MDDRTLRWRNAATPAATDMVLLLLGYAATPLCFDVKCVEIHCCFQARNLYNYRNHSIISTNFDDAHPAAVLALSQGS